MFYSSNFREGLDWKTVMNCCDENNVAENVWCIVVRPRVKNIAIDSHPDPVRQTNSLPKVVHTQPPIANLPLSSAMQSPQICQCQFFRLSEQEVFLIHIYICICIARYIFQVGAFDLTRVCLLLPSQEYIWVIKS